MCRLIVGILLPGLSSVSYPEQTFSPAASESSLSDTVNREVFVPQSPSPKATASISGTVLDINEGVVSKASITLEDHNGLAEYSEMTDGAGLFSFRNLQAGSFKVRITAPGLEPFESSEIILHEGEKYRLPNIALPIAVAKVNLNVTVTEEQLANEQVHAELQQRVLGIFPNFYTSFIWNAAPLTPKQKFRLAFRSATDIDSFLNAGILAGVQQARDTYPAYGQGAQGYGKRYGAAYGDLFLGHMFSGAVFSSVFHQDPRYFYQGSGSVPSRTWHAVSSAFICRGDNGHLQFNYSHVLGNLVAGGISNVYRPEEDRGVWLAVNNALLHSAALVGANLVREFALRSLTTKVPSYAKGKQEPAAKVTPQP